MATSTKALLSAVLVTGAGSTVLLDPNKTQYTFQCRGATSASTGSATVDVEVSNDGTGWTLLGTFSMQLSTTSGAEAQGFAADMNWVYARGNVTAISGTGANVTLTMGV